MKLLLSSSAAALLITFSGAALAQAPEWTGGYIGAQAGYGFKAENDDETVQFDTDLNGSFGDTVRTGAGANAFSPGFCEGRATGVAPGAGCEKQDRGFEFGARAGYDMQFGSFVVGVVGEVSRTNVHDAISAFSTTPASYTMERELNALAAARVRGGFALGRTLAYATGGYATGQVDRRFRTTNTANTFTRTSGDDWVDGWQLGGGLEHKVTNDVSLGLEYLLTELEDDGYTVRAGGPVPATNPFVLTNPAGTNFQRTEDDLRIHSVRVTAAYRF